MIIAFTLPVVRIYNLNSRLFQRRKVWLSCFSIRQWKTSCESVLQQMLQKVVVGSRHHVRFSHENRNIFFRYIAMLLLIDFALVFMSQRHLKLGNVVLLNLHRCNLPSEKQVAALQNMLNASECSNTASAD